MWYCSHKKYTIIWRIFTTYACWSTKSEYHESSCLREDRSFFWPPRIREICSPLLKAWLNSIRVWNSETKGNHAKIVIGVKRSTPIIISYALARARTDPHNPTCRATGLQACAIWKSKILINQIEHYEKQQAYYCSKEANKRERERRTSNMPHPVGKNARKHTNISRKFMSRNTIKTIRIAMKQTNIKNFIRRKNSWKSALNLRLPIDTVCKQYRQILEKQSSK